MNRTWNVPRVAYWALLMVSGTAHAFCVYNDTDKIVRYRGIGMSDFAATLAAKSGADATKACCNWKDKGCNPTKEQTGLVQMTLTVKNMYYGSKAWGETGWRDGQCGSQFKIDYSKPFSSGQGDGYGMRVQAGGYAIARTDGAGKYWMEIYEVGGKNKEWGECTVM